MLREGKRSQTGNGERKEGSETQKVGGKQELEQRGGGKKCKREVETHRGRESSDKDGDDLPVKWKLRAREMKGGHGKRQN